jgi:hypothetical protein
MSWELLLPKAKPSAPASNAALAKATLGINHLFLTACGAFPEVTASLLEKVSSALVTATSFESSGTGVLFFVIGSNLSVTADPDDQPA